MDISPTSFGQYGRIPRYSGRVRPGRRVVDAVARVEFRKELSDLQTDLRNYTRLLADLADVEDLTDLEAV